MNDAVKRRSMSVLDALTGCINGVEALNDEVVQMLIRGDDNRRIPPVLIPHVERINQAASDMKESLEAIYTYVNRKQETHRL